MGWVLFSFHLQRSYSLVVSDEVRECTWLGSPMCAAGGGSSTWGNTWESRTLPDSAWGLCLGKQGKRAQHLYKENGRGAEKK